MSSPSAVARVDALLAEDPSAALRLATEHFGQASDWRALAALGSAKRACSDLLGAREALYLAIELTERLRGGARRTARLDLAKRVSHLYLDLGEYAKARALVEWRLRDAQNSYGRALASADLSAVIYAEGGTSAAGLPLLAEAIASPRPQLCRYGWQISAGWAIADSDGDRAAACLRQLEQLPQSGAGGRYNRWLRALSLRASGEFAAAFEQLGELFAEWMDEQHYGQAGCALLDAAICAQLANDAALTVEASGKAFLLLSRCGVAESRAAIVTFANAINSGQLSIELAYELRLRLRTSRRAG